MKTFEARSFGQKCIRKLLRPEILAENRGIFDSQTFAAQIFAENLEIYELQTFAARSFGQNLRSQMFVAQIFGQNNAFKNVCNQNFRPKIAADQFENVCSGKLRPKNPFENVCSAKFRSKMHSQTFAAGHLGRKS